MKVKMGFLPCHSENYYAMENHVIERCMRGASALAEALGTQIIPFPAIIDGNGARRAREYFEQEKIDYLLLLNAAFSTGDIMMEFDGCKIPMGVWAVPDEKDEGDIELNATVSANMFLSIAQRNFKETKKIKWFYGYPEERHFQERFRITLQALRGVKVLQTGKIGVLGTIAPTFFNLKNDEQFEKTLGLSFSHLTMEELIKEINALTEEEQEKMKQRILQSANDCSRLPVDSLDQGAKILAALWHLADQYQISALAASCWPDFQDLFSVVPCVPFTLLSKWQGVPTACEGDVGGAISLLIGKAVGGKSPTLMDLASLNFEKNEILLWHCGIGSVDMQPEEGVSIIPHPMLDRKNPNRKQMGLSYNYVMKEMPITVLRYSNSHKIMAFEGKIDANQKGYTGTRGFISNLTSGKKLIPLENIVDTIVREGIEHHLILCPGHIEESIHECADILGIPWISIKS